MYKLGFFTLNFYYKTKYEKYVFVKKIFSFMLFESSKNENKKLYYLDVLLIVISFSPV